MVKPGDVTIRTFLNLLAGNFPITSSILIVLLEIASLQFVWNGITDVRSSGICSWLSLSLVGSWILDMLRKRGSPKHATEFSGFVS